MEPDFENPALEKQAVGRVHRLGQKREVEIVRLLVRDSIETRICKLLETKYGISSNAGSKEGSDTGTGKEDSEKAEHGMVQAVGSLSSERPKNRMVTSEFDLLFGVDSKSEILDSAMPDIVVSSDML